MTKISELVELLSVANSDELIINDTSEPLDVDKTKKVKVSTLVTAAITAAIASMGMQLIEKKLLTSPAASFDFTSIPATFSHLKLIILARSDDTGLAYRALSALFNNDTGNNYDYRYRMTTINATTMQVSQLQAQSSAYFGVPIPTSLATTGMAGSCEILIPNYAGTVFRKNYHSRYFRETAESDPDNDMVTGEVDGHWRSTDAINRITLIPQAGNFIAGSIASLYGIL